MTNCCLAVALAAVVGVVSPTAAAVLLCLSFASIWLRGYLVPGTPELTKRYFPDWLLAKFDKVDRDGAAATAAADTGAAEPFDFDPEATLLSAGVVEPCPGGDDLCLGAEFETAWERNIARLRDRDVEHEALAEQLGTDPDEITVERYGEAAVVQGPEGRVGQWESRAALLADLGAAAELPSRVDEWESLPLTAQSQLLEGLRAFVETCPDCGGSVTMRRNTVESCCRSYPVVTTECEACESRLLEVPAEGAQPA